MPQFNRGKAHAHDFLANTIRGLLVDETYVFDADSDFVADIVADELTDASYTATGDSGRITLTTKTITYDDTEDEAEHNADDLQWPALDNEQFDGLVLFKFVTNDADSVLISYHPNTGGTKTANGGDIDIPMPTEGWYKGT